MSADTLTGWQSTTDAAERDTDTHAEVLMADFVSENITGQHRPIVRLLIDAPPKVHVILYWKHMQWV